MAFTSTITRLWFPLRRRLPLPQHVRRTRVAQVIPTGRTALVAPRLVLVRALAYELGAAPVVGGDAGAQAAAEHLGGIGGLAALVRRVDAQELHEGDAAAAALCVLEDGDSEAAGGESF